MKYFFLAGTLVALFLSVGGHASERDPMSLDAFFDYVNLQSVEISPDGESVLIVTKRPDWQQSRYRFDIWLSRQGAAPELLTQSGTDDDPAWSPDGRWIAFTSSRDAAHSTQLYLVRPDAGDAIAVTRGEDSIRAFAWSPDSQFLYFAKTQAMSQSEKANEDERWHGAIEYRESQRGDALYRIKLSEAVQGASAKPQPLAQTPFLVRDIAVSHDGRTLAFNTSPRSHQREEIRDYEIFLLDANGGTPRQLTHNETSESSPTWSGDDWHLFFTTYGNPIGHWEQVQERVYAIDVKTGAIERWGANFAGALGGVYAIGSDGTLLATGVLGAETRIYEAASATAGVTVLPGANGSYSSVSFAARSPKVAFIRSAWGEPAEVYVADDVKHLAEAKRISHFNDAFLKFELPKGRTYRWKSDDGIEIEGVLLYPPGKFGAKHLPMLTLIHGGPVNTDGDRFRADWYDWSVLAAMHGYLVFRPNYRGSAAYGDDFVRAISPHIVSAPGRDVLTGVDALVKDGIADPDRLAVGGYSYGGFLTNWLITQTTRFKAALSGAGAVEHIMEWGNDDLPLDDIEMLGGYPWQVPQHYNDEAAIFQMEKVKTPTHIVAGLQDVRVYIGEQYLLERSLEALSVPHKLLLFPGEGHLLGNDPWHGKIKVREELLWLEKYCPADARKN
jgi:dipeptidyl aminopeptidase/acylaminoacyl peptidase